MSLNHITPLDGERSGEVIGNFLRKTYDSGRAIVAIVGVAVTGIPDAIRDITAKEPNPISAQSPVKPHFM